MTINLEHIKKQFDMVKNAGTFVITTQTVSKLIEEVEHLQFENETIRRNRITQERKDFNRIKQFITEIHNLKAIAKIKGEETASRIQALETANDLLYMEKQEYEKALIDIVNLPTAQYIKDGQIISYKTIAQEALGEGYDSQTQK